MSENEDLLHFMVLLKKYSSLKSFALSLKDFIYLLQYINIK